MTKITTVEDWVQHKTKEILTDLVNELDNQATVMDNQVLDLLQGSIIASLVGTFVLATIKNSSDAKEASQNFSKLVNSIQGAVSSGIQSGVYSATGDSVDYWCTIQEVPEMDGGLPS